MPKWEKEEFDILTNNYGKTHINNLIKLLPNHTKSSIRKKAHVFKLKVPNRSFCYKKYFFNESYFDIPNVENCYWAGFIAADGNLSNKACGLVINISAKDNKLLQQFINHVQFTGKIRYFTQNEFNYVGLSIWRADRWHEKLDKNWNITQRKTYTLQPPNLQDDLSYAFLVGFFDGDGCWKKYKIPTENNNKYSFGFSGTNAMMQWVKKILNQLVPEEKTINVPKRGNYYVYQACGQRAVVIREKLKQIVNIPWRLARKWED